MLHSEEVDIRLNTRIHHQFLQDYCYCFLNYSLSDMSKRNKNLNNIERRKRKAKLVKMIGGCCKRCGYKKCYASLSFHHRNPETKSFDISHNGNLLHSWEDVVKEALKCDLLCLNCHSELNDSQTRNHNRGRSF